MFSRDIIENLEAGLESFRTIPYIVGFWPLPDGRMTRSSPMWKEGLAENTATVQKETT